VQAAISPVLAIAGTEQLTTIFATRAITADALIFRLVPDTLPAKWIPLALSAS